MILKIISLLLMSWAFIMFGVMDKLVHHYPQLSNPFFKKNPQFWDPSISWKNKYKEDTFDPKFLGSTSIFVFVTDGWHLLQWFAYTFIALSLTILITDNIIDFILVFIFIRIVTTTMKYLTMVSL